MGKHARPVREAITFCKSVGVAKKHRVLTMDHFAEESVTMMEMCYA